MSTSADQASRADLGAAPNSFPRPVAAHTVFTSNERALSRLGLAAAVLVYAVLAIGYATRTPLWQNPDEPAHYNYVVHVATTGSLPELREGDWDSALLERLKTGRLDPGDRIEAIRYEGWQPPLYYILAAGVYGLGPSDHAASVLRVRLLGVVLGALTLLVAFAAARKIGSGENLQAAAVPTVLAGVPMFTAVSASVSADPLANLVAAVLVLTLLLAVKRPIGMRQALGIGALLGLGMLTKLGLAIFVPLALLVLLLKARRPIQAVAAACCTTAIVLLPWLFHQVRAYGWTDPLASARHAAVVADQPRFPGFSADYVWSFLTTTFHSFWAQFGWMAIPAPDRLYWIWGALTLVALAGLIACHMRLRQSSWLVLIGICAAASIALVGYNLSYKQFQGRYLFTALVPFSILLVQGWAAWFPMRFRALGTLGLAWMLVALNAYTLARVLIPGFAAT